MLRIVLTLLACAFWLVPLAGAVHLARLYGLTEDIPAMLVIPVLMIALTLAAAWATVRSRRPRAILAAATLVAVCGAVYWLALWGKGV